MSGEKSRRRGESSTVECKMRPSHDFEVRRESGNGGVRRHGLQTAGKQTLSSALCRRAETSWRSSGGRSAHGLGAFVEADVRGGDAMCIVVGSIGGEKTDRVVIQPCS
jgi:hypothetical protein